MRRETLIASVVLGVVAWELSRWGFSAQVKREKRAGRVDIVDKSRLEVHHITPEHLTHDDSPENAVALTREEHALVHLQRAWGARDWTERRREYQAVQTIVRRMTAEELARFNRDIARRRV